MENATKALLIAAGVLIAIMILSLLVMAYTEISSYYAQKSEDTVIKQAQEFNNQFENYNRKKIRGSDMISLMNKIMDYNVREADGKNYKKIEVKIDLKGCENQFDSNSGYGSLLIPGEINSANEITNVTEIETDLISELNSLGISNPSNSHLQTLAANISNIIINENATDSYSIKNRMKRYELLKTNLNFTVNINPSNYKTTSGQNKVEKLKKIAAEYYQFTQFKRAYFDCIEAIYDEQTGRVCEMNFEIRTSGGNVQFN